MTLSKTLSKSFPLVIRDRGQRYFNQGRVRITDAQDALVMAKVRGTRAYNVLLSREGMTLQGGCDCPYFEDNGALCKHLWALVLAVERKGSPDWAAMGVTKVEADGDDFDLDDQDEDEDFVDDEVEPIVHVPRVQRPAAPPAPKPPAWQTELRRIAQLQHPGGEDDEPAWPIARRVFYLLDLPEDLRAGYDWSDLERGLGLELVFSDPTAAGAWSKPKFRRASLGQLSRTAQGADREILALLCGVEGQNQLQDGSSYLTLASRYRLRGAQLDHLLPLLCATGRCLLRGQDPLGSAPGLAWDGGPPWDLELELERADGVYHLAGRLHRGAEERPLPCPGLWASQGLLGSDGRLNRLADARATHWVWLLQGPERLSIPAAQVADFLEGFFGQAWTPHLVLPKDLDPERVAETPQPGLTLQSAQRLNIHGTANLIGQVHFSYGGQRVAGELPQERVYIPQEKRLVVRDRGLERAAYGRLEPLGFQPVRLSNGGDQGLLQIHPAAALAAAGTLVAEGWSVEAEGRIYRRASGFQVAVSTGLDWFDLKLEADFGGQRPSLPELLAGLKQPQGLVRLGDGSVGVLPADWLKQAGLLVGLGQERAGGLRFRRSQAGLLDLLLASQEGTKVSSDAGFKRVRDALAGFETPAAAEEPPGFKGTLRPYQREGLGWLRFLRQYGLGGCLADDMGLGKTVQVLALLEGLRGAKGGGPKRPSLLVVPRSLVFNWQQEAGRFAPKLKLLVHSGAQRAKSAVAFDDRDVVLTTYGTLRKDILLFKDAEFDSLILDESQAAKNAASDTAKSIRLLNGAHRLALSGTPVENHLGELWTLFDFLNPGLLGASSALKMAAGREPGGETRALLSLALKPFILRRTKEKVAKDLPAKLEQTLYCELEPLQRRHYDELRDHYRASLSKRVEKQGLAKSKIWVLEALLRLRQAACHSGLIDRSRVEEPSAKLEALLPRLVEVVEEGHKALVFSQFTSFLAILKSRLDQAGLAYEYLDGRTRDRAGAVARFQQDPGRRIFLISLKAGGLGLNLTQADYVFLLDPWWNPAVEAQAVDRAHRLGQTRQVFAYRLIAKDTVEEKVLQLQASKRRLADDILNADENLIRSLTKADLEALFA